MKNDVFLRKWIRIAYLFGIISSILVSHEGHSGESTYTEKLIQSYGNLTSYCDSGRFINDHGLPKDKLTGTFERCFRDDGSYKQSKYLDTVWKHTYINWSDGENIYKYIGRLDENDDGTRKEGALITTSLQEGQVNKNIEKHKKEYVTTLILQRFIGSISYVNKYWALNKHRVNSQLSNREFTVLEYKKPDSIGLRMETYRLWISNSDNLIRKSEVFWDSKRVSLVELSSIRKNTALTESDLLHDITLPHKPKPSFVQSNFHDDRCYTRTNVPLEPKISRLFIGKESTNRCSGNTIERCVEWLGEADEVKNITSKEAQFIFFGKKHLYRGTGIENKPIGLERREMTVVDGRVVDEYSTIQILEHGYSWMPSKPVTSFDSGNYSCERYGECGTSTCSRRLTPFEPIPQVQESPPILRNYSIQELAALYRQLVTLNACSSLSEEYRLLRTKILKDWNIEKPGVAEALENTPEYSIDVGLVKYNFELSNRSRRQEVELYCNNLLPQGITAPNLE